MDFSFSELAPKKLFDSRDTVINIADDILGDNDDDNDDNDDDDVADDILDDNKQTQNTFGTPVVLRRGHYNARYIVKLQVQGNTTQ